MNKSDISKIKNRLRSDNHNPIEIRGWYVNSKKAVISELSKSIASMGQTESDKYMQIFKRVLSGDIGKNLSIVKFPLSEVMDGKLHERLMQLSSDSFDDEILMQSFVQEVIDKTQLEGNNLILLMHDIYDTDYMSMNGDEGAIENENPSHVFKYLICAVCPVKLSKPALSYDSKENNFITREPDWVVSAPSLGFMFPCFEDMGANISNALFYSKDMAEDHNDFLSTITEGTLTPANESKEAFKAVLRDALEEECSLDVVQSVNDRLIEKLDEQKKDKTGDPKRIGAKELSDVLVQSGVSDDRAFTFAEKFEEEFGTGADLPLAGITDDKSFEVKTNDVLVKVSPRQASLIETRVIDGMKYILIPADEGVTVNGISIDI
ncbi:MAG: DUF4317 domain-containing protein [Clostridia bacterium]|nr:DUF4317 domain-containing protein [Clostridia bacterium]